MWVNELEIANVRTLGVKRMKETEGKERERRSAKKQL
jgi:hypothetical protein